jgi:hypothetical protein
VRYNWKTNGRVRISSTSLHHKDFKSQISPPLLGEAIFKNEDKLDRLAETKTKRFICQQLKRSTWDQGTCSSSVDIIGSSKRRRLGVKLMVYRRLTWWVCGNIAPQEPTGAGADLLISKEFRTCAQQQQQLWGERASEPAEAAVAGLEEDGEEAGVCANLSYAWVSSQALVCIRMSNGLSLA